MASPANLFGPTPESLRNKANWLGRYLAVQKGFDQELAEILSDAAQDTSKRFEKLTGTKGFSKTLRRTQLALAQRQIKKDLNERFGQISNIIRNNQQDAAVAAVSAGIFDQRGILARIFQNPSDRKQYAESLEQTARRNVEAVMTRTLSSARPLSERVYKTKALSNGLVDRAINRGLSRGDSALDIANSVKSLIRPDVPGGISYAARRLGRTEINNAFHAQSIFDSEETPWVNQMEWHLSKVHKNDDDDPCEDYALERYFQIGHIPEKPHPNCLCYVTPVVEDYDIFERNLLAGQYDSYIEDQMGIPASKIINKNEITPSNKAIDISSVLPGAKEVPENWYDATDLDQLTRGFQSRWYTPQLGNIELTNWTSENISVETAREILRATDNLMVKYPQSQGYISQLVIRAAGDNEYARTIRTANGNNIIAFNQSWTRDHEAFKKAIQKDVSSGFHPPNTDIEPWNDMLTHEFGHVLDHIGDVRARDAANRVAMTYFKENVQPYPTLTKVRDQLKSLSESSPIVRKTMQDAGINFEDSEFLKKELEKREKLWEKSFGHWIDENSSEYARSSIGYIDHSESLAEAFVDLERNGDKATPLSKALSNKLIEESKKDLPTRPLLNLEEGSPDKSGLVKGDYSPNPVDFKEFFDVPDDRGRWEYAEVHDPRNDETRHDFTINPKVYPAVKEHTSELGQTSRIFYDPDETSFEITEFGRINPTVKEKKLAESVIIPEEKLIWRGMSSEEYENALKNGYFESKGFYNVGGESQAGKTYFTDKIDQAENYATWYAPPEFKPTFDHPSYVVGIPDRPNIIREQGSEVGVSGKIALSEVQKVYVAKPYAISPGQTGISEGWNGWEKSGSSQATIYTKWSESVLPTTSSSDKLTDEILDLIGGARTPKIKEVVPEIVEAPIEGVPIGYEKYVKTLLAQESRVETATVYMPTDLLKKYREYDRATELVSKDQIDALEYVVRKQGGILSPLQLSTDGKSALLHEGNHRLVVAERLGIKELPVKITFDKEIIRNEGLKPATLDDNLKTFVQQRLSVHNYDKGPEVFWTGPKVDAPHEDLDHWVQDFWTSDGYDSYKDEIREGAKIAQEEGWDGAIPDIKSFESNSFYGKQEGLNIIGRETVSRAIDEEPFDQSIYRGMILDEEDLNKLKEAKEISLPASSFSPDMDMALNYADKDSAWWRSYDAPEDGKGILIEVLPGSKSAYIDLRERAAFGRFRVVEYKPGMRSVNRGVDRLVLQQVSMIEDDIGVSRSVSKKVKDAGIPDISFVKNELSGTVKPIYETIGPLDQSRKLLEDRGIQLKVSETKLDQKAVDEVVSAVTDLAKSYPDAGMKELVFGKSDSNEYAYTEISGIKLDYVDGVEKEINYSRVLFNDSLSSSYSDWKDHSIKDADSGFHYHGSDENPFRATMFHEYGHVMQNRLGKKKVTSKEVDKALIDHWTKKVLPLYDSSTVTAKTKEILFKDWLDQQLSGYSFFNKRTRDIDAEEALAEAFEVVERMGPDAPSGAKVLYNLLIKKYVKFIEKGVENNVVQ